MWRGSRNQRIGFFHDIGAAAARGLGGQKDKTADGKRRRPEIAARRQIGGDVGLAGAVQARQGDVRGEAAALGRKANTLQDAFKFGLQVIEGRRRLDPGPERTRPPIAERAKTIERQFERRPDDLVKGVGDIVGERPLDIADKAQGDVVIFRADPTGAGQAAVQHR
jgi:hypothetical protein